ncbi:unnamed protein product [Peniophora sp. CBMAI 1063]|nr:unnamed protein product [Peniophora sp. CBMAI 1063]
MSSAPRAKGERPRKRGSALSPSEGWESEEPTDSRAILLARYSVNTLAWLVVVVLAAFLAVHCDRYIALRRHETSLPEYIISSNADLKHALGRVSDTYHVNELIEELSGFDAATPAPIHLSEVDLQPTDPICLREGFGDADAGDWVAVNPNFEGETSGSRRRSRGHLAFARDAHAYVVDTGYDSGIRAQLHVIPGASDMLHSTVDVTALYDDSEDPDTRVLDAFDVCTYRADSKPEDGTWPQYDNGPLLADVFRIQRRPLFPGATDADKNLNGGRSLSNIIADVHFNVTLTIPSGKNRSLHGLKVGRYDVKLHKDVTIRELDIYTPGRVHAQKGFGTTGSSIRTYGPRGNVTGHFDVAYGDLDVRTDGAGVNARFDVARGQREDGMTRYINFEVNDGSLNVKLWLDDEALDPCAHVPKNVDPHCVRYRPFAFDIHATSSNHPQEIMLLDHSLYPSGVNIYTRSTNAPSRLKLDPSFEGTYHYHSAKNHYGGEIMYRIPEVDPSGKGRKRVRLEGLTTQYGYTGAVGWGSEEAAKKGASFAEVYVDADQTNKAPEVDRRPIDARKAG